MKHPLEEEEEYENEIEEEDEENQTKEGEKVHQVSPKKPSNKYKRIIL
jgi:hypothetical protein